MAYFDHAATTPLDKRIAEAMRPWLGDNFGNASSMHRYGRAARAAIDQARQQVADFAGVSGSQVIFTPSGTTANNLALLGYLRQDEGRRLWLSRIEHSSVQSAADSLNPARVEWLATDSSGRVGVDFDAAGRVRAGDLLTVMMANNETGTIQPIVALAQKAHSIGMRMHCDAVQAAGKTTLNFGQLGVDSLTVTAHKIYGPVGASALIISNCADLDPIIFGGGHECGLFSGTENTAAVVGLGLACELAAQEMQQRCAHIGALQQGLEDRLSKEFGARIFAQESERVPGVTMFAIAGVHGEMLVMHCDREGFAVSSGSACHSTVTRPSPVLRSMGVEDHLALSAVRISLGRDNTATEVDEFSEKLHKILGALVVKYGT